MLGQRRRRWPNINSALDKRIVHRVETPAYYVTKKEKLRFS